MPIGQYDVRVVTPVGLSNFRAFVVGDWPEALEKEPNNELAQAQRVTCRSSSMAGSTADRRRSLRLRREEGAAGHHQLLGLADRQPARRHADAATTARARSWPTPATTTARIRSSTSLIPEDGDYVVKIWDFVYGGGNDYVYRLQIGSLPHLDAVIPAAVPPTGKTTVTIYGRNLPDGKPAPAGFEVLGRPLEMITREIEAPAQRLGLRGGEALRPAQAALDGFDFRLTSADGSSNPIFIGVTTDPIVLEQEPNNDRETAQRLTVPCDVTGTLRHDG